MKFELLRCKLKFDLRLLASSVFVHFFGVGSIVEIPSKDKHLNRSECSQLINTVSVFFAKKNPN